MRHVSEAGACCFSCHFIKTAPSDRAGADSRYHCTPGRGSRGMNENRPIGMSRRAMVALLVAVFTASVGYGVVLPILPHLVENLSPAASSSDVGWHTGLSTAIYTAAQLLFAPVWGRMSDHQGRRPILLISLAGFAITLAATAIASNLLWLYAGRFLNGVFAAAILPVAQAFVGDRAVSNAWRARRFAWLGMASIAGFLVGPMLGGIIFQVGRTAAVGTVSSSMPAAQFLELPFLLSAALVFVGLFVAFGIEKETALSPVRPAAEESNKRQRATTTHLLSLTGLVAAGVTAFEVTLALRGRTLGMAPYEVGIMFAECSVVMFAVQALVFSPLVAPSATARLIAPALAVMALGLLFVPYAVAFAAQVIVVGTVAASAGILIPALTYWISLGAGRAQGAELGRQSAIASIGQTLGSAGGGVFYRADAAPYLELLLAGLILAAAAASLHLARRLSAENVEAAGTAAGSDGALVARMSGQSSGSQMVQRSASNVSGR